MSSPFSNFLVPNSSLPVPVTLLTSFLSVPRWESFSIFLYSIKSWLFLIRKKLDSLITFRGHGQCLTIRASNDVDFLIQLNWQISEKFWASFRLPCNHNRLPLICVLSKISLGWTCQLVNCLPGKSGIPNIGISKLYSCVFLVMIPFLRHLT